MGSIEYRMVVKGIGGCSYYGPSDGSLSYMRSLSHTIDLEYLSEGTVVVDYSECDDFGALTSWVINGPAVSIRESRSVRSKDIDAFLSVAADHFLKSGALEFPDLDQSPLGRWLRLLQLSIPSVKVGRVENGQIVWEEPVEDEEVDL